MSLHMQEYLLAKPRETVLLIAVVLVLCTCIATQTLGHRPKIKTCQSKVNHVTAINVMIVDIKFLQHRTVHRKLNTRLSDSSRCQFLDYEPLCSMYA